MSFFLSILTPSYNRANYLSAIFHCLCQQTMATFEWLIVDDGSTDDTAHVVETIQQSKTTAFPIRYFRKANGGKHTAVNLGVKEAQGELVLILDSDDELLPNAVETIARRWVETQQSMSSGSMQTIGGMAFCMAHRNGESITNMLQPQQTLPIEAHEIDLRYKYGIQGDLCEVFRTDVLRKFPFPEIPGERFCPEQLVWFRIARQYKLRVYSDTIYLRDYLDGGLTDNIIRIRMNSPISTCMTYAEMMDYDIPLRQKTKAAINFFRFRNSINHCQGMVSCLKWYWWVLQPIGTLMYKQDLKTISKS